MGATGPRGERNTRGNSKLMLNMTPPSQRASCEHSSSHPCSPVPRLTPLSQSTSFPHAPLCGPLPTFPGIPTPPLRIASQPQAHPFPPLSRASPHVGCGTMRMCLPTCTCRGNECPGPWLLLSKMAEHCTGTGRPLLGTGCSSERAFGWRTLHGYVEPSLNSRAG